MATPCFVEGISTQKACQYVVCHVNPGGDWRARAPRRISGGFGGSPARSSARSVVHHMNAMRHLDPDHRCAGALHKCDVFDADQSMDGEISIPSHPAAARRNPRGGRRPGPRRAWSLQHVPHSGGLPARRRHGGAAAARRMAARPWVSPAAGNGQACGGCGRWRERRREAGRPAPASGLDQALLPRDAHQDADAHPQRHQRGAAVAH